MSLIEGQRYGQIGAATPLYETTHAMRDAVWQSEDASAALVPFPLFNRFSLILLLINWIALGLN